jgi:hypothetical protein
MAAYVLTCRAVVEAWREMAAGDAEPIACGKIKIVV